MKMLRREDVRPELAWHSPARDAVPFFIIGTGRSGTTMLRLILAGHSRLHVCPETWFVRDLVRLFPRNVVLRPEQVAAAIDVMTQHKRWHDLKTREDELREAVARLERPTIAGLLSIVYRHEAALAGKPRVGDKTPGYFEIVPELAAMFPGARFIHLIRDGRDVAMSWHDLDWQRYHEGDGFEWTRNMRHWRSWRGTKLADSILDVHYEDIVAQPEAQMRRICAFLGEDFEPGMLTWDDRLDLIPPRDQGLHTKLARPMRQDLAGGWRSLRAMECFAMEACLGADLRAQGYALRFRSPAWRPALAAAGGLLRLASPLLRRVVPALQRRRLLPGRLYL